MYDFMGGYGLNTQNSSITLDFKIRQLAKDVNNLLTNTPYRYDVQSKLISGRTSFDVVIYYNTSNGIRSEICHNGSGTSAEAYLNGVKDTLMMMKG